MLGAGERGRQEEVVVCSRYRGRRREDVHAQRELQRLPPPVCRALPVEVARAALQMAGGVTQTKSPERK